MSWSNTLQDASFRGVPFEVYATSDQGGKVIAVHQIPYTNGAEVEDMGNDPAGFEVRALLRGEAYETALQALIKALQTSGPGELVHPIFGALNVVAVRWAIEHEADIRDACVLTIRFLEHRISAAVFATPSASASADRVAALSKQARESATDSVAGKVAGLASKPLVRVTEINETFNTAKRQLRTLLDTTSVRVLLADLDPLLYPRAALADLEAIVDGAFAGLPLGGINGLFTGTLSAVGMSAALVDFNRLLQGQDPTTTVTPTSSDPQEGEVAAALTAYSRVLNATTVASAATLIMAAELDALELERSDIERLAATARTGLQAAIDAARTSLDAQRGAEVAGLLAAAGYEVQEAARAAMELRPPLITRTAPVGGHARLLAHALYGDHTRAAELQRLNRWGRQVLIEAGQEIRCYAR